MKTCFVLAVWALISLGCGSSHESKVHTVIGTDDRPFQSFDLTVAPRQSIGRLVLTPENGSEKYCTATLVRADVVLTAAHCLVFPADKFSYGFFYSAYEQGNFSAEYVVKSFVLGTSTPSTVDGRKHDWALVKVEHTWGKAPAPLKMAGQAAAALRYPLTVDLQGYSSDRLDGEVPSFHLGCRLLKAITPSVKSNAPLGTISHDCDAEPGSSGAALVQRTLSGFQIVAINAAGNHDLFDYTGGSSEPINVAVDTKAAAAALTRMPRN
ncbi:trypsin-like serine peptidase [Oligoflexus tunisiensis]|uniref:trypsin-like serine peptidase n=1 Tax=Oligoflexus tunisiensis TaxID=708132 RepID=UPI00114D3328|nr:trypsin-like serine protease [Oligoflexus tunisiensis]